MRPTKPQVSSWLLMFAFVAVTSGCTPGSDGANDVGDQIDRALDPEPDYVDPPAPEPQRPR